MIEVDKNIIGKIKNDHEYYDILEDIKQKNYSMKDVLKLLVDTETGNYTDYDIARCIVYFTNLIENENKLNLSEMKLKKVIDELDKRVLEPEKTNKYAGLTIGETLLIRGFIQRELLEEN